jgi:uncharacterized protein YbbC (DUF1343 family)
MRHGRLEVLKRVMVTVLLAGCAGTPPPRGVAGPRTTVPPTAVEASRITVRPGIDVLLRDSIAIVRGKRIGLVTNMAAVDAQGNSDITRLRSAGVHLVALFAPEHGLSITAAPGETVASGMDATANIPIYSLYGQRVAPTPEMLRGLDLVLVDLPDVGARYFTYLATTVEVMKAAGSSGIPVVVLDRPNPIGGATQGNVLDPAFSSMVGRLAVPMRHGLTLGEEARLARAELWIRVTLAVVPVDGWRRDQLIGVTGLPFRAPSPNLQDPEALFHYPGLCLFEGTALSVGRGSDAPFHQIGAPWLDTVAVLAKVRAAKLPGVAFRGVTFTPHRSGDGKFNDTPVMGIRLEATDVRRYDPTAAAVYLLAAVQAVHPGAVAIGGSFDRLAGGPALRLALLRGDAPATIVASWRPALERYRTRVKPFLLYP